MFTLPKELTIAQMETCKTELLQFIENNNEISVDDSQVVRIDTLGVQLILAMVFFVKAQNKKLNLIIENETILQGFAQLGIQDNVMSQYLK
ncbi:STAS domain-containing protein [Thalassotalea ganghwensis]